ncbi:MAG: hypothetical protein MZW92_66835 [Comamonadaceae bacterium]|nr:hypothetical protein [Comamonadaceae bacterium]
MIKIGVHHRHVRPVLPTSTAPGSAWRRSAWRSRTSAQRSPGMKIEVVFADHQNKADVALARSRAVVSTATGVDVIVDVHQLRRGAGRQPGRRARRSKAFIVVRRRDLAT